jgi:hypothetical protein
MPTSTLKVWLISMSKRLVIKTGMAVSNWDITRDTATYVIETPDGVLDLSD